MSTESFVHLHVHTQFSLLDGACKLADAVDLALENNMPALAITDHGVMYGAVDFYKEAREKGVKPIIGCEIYVAPDLHRKETPADARNNHLLLLAANDVGYKNLARLVSTAHLEGFYYKPRIDHELLAANSKGLIGLSACLKGELASLLLENNIAGATALAGTYADIFGKDSFFLEIQDHGIADQRKANALMADLSKNTGLPLVATNDVHYLRREHAAAHEVLLCLQTGTVLSDPKHMSYSGDQFYMKTRKEMETCFRDYPEALDITLEIADRCNVEFEFGTLHFPTFTVPEGKTQRQHLVDLSYDGIRLHYNVADPAKPATDREREIMGRFDQELAVIEKTGFVNYFLVVWDFVHFARQNNIPVGPGRGSGGGSLIAFVLGITTIDPLRYDLIFERFLNPERVSPPDFDIDFCQSKRGRVIEYVKQKYGRENVAQIITFGSLGAKTVVRDVGRVLEVPFTKCDQISKMIPEDPKMTLKKAIDTSPDFRNAYESDSDCKRILDFGFVLEGLYRNPGVHAAGVVIGERPLIEILPLARDKDGQSVTQYSMEPLGDIGLLKMDFLGLKTLTVIQETVELVKKFRDIDIDVENLPFDDEAAYALLNRGDTIGVFQLESGGMRDLVRKLEISRIEDVIALIALYRPGPMNMLPEYIERKTGNAEFKYDHPLLESILAETYGVMVYQEQVQKAANILAGYSLGEADILRRAMGKKKASEMEKQRAKFVDGCATVNKISAKLAGRIFDNMEKFAGYGFNKAHSAGYAIVSYQTAYLKANYPAEFMSALLSSEIGNFDKIPVFIAEAKDMDLEILPPDICSSDTRFTPDGNGLRYGLAGVKNVGAVAAATIVEERDLNGPFTDLVSFCSRIDGQLVNKKVLESLIRCGAMDSLNAHRAALFNGLDFAMARSADALSDKRSGQGSLFDLLDDDQPAALETEIPVCEPWHENELLACERELLGIYMSGHPLTQYATLLERYQLTNVEGIPNIDDRTPTRLGGIISKLTKRVIKSSQKNMAILELEDLDGTIEVLVFAEAFEAYGAQLAQDKAVLVCGEVSRKEDQPRLVASEIYALEDAPRFFAQRLSVHLPAAGLTPEKLALLKELIRLHPGHVPVVICLQYASGEKVFLDTDRSFTVVPDESLVHQINHEFGEKTAYVSVNPKACLKEPRRKRWQRNGS